MPTKEDTVARPEDSETTARQATAVKILRYVKPDLDRVKGVVVHRSLRLLDQGFYDDVGDAASRWLKHSPGAASMSEQSNLARLEPVGGHVR